VIILCKKCGLKYRFDASQIDGDGIWVRCSHCKTVFFQENPTAEIDVPKDAVRPGKTIGEEICRENPEDAEQKELYGGDIEITDDAKTREKISSRRPRLLGVKTLFFLILVIFLSGGAYLWFSPHAKELIGNRVLPHVEKLIGILPGVEKLFGTGSGDVSDINPQELAVDLVKVRERFLKNWLVGDIMVVEGLAVNNNKYSITGIKVRGKILDAAGEILGEEESGCGNILTDDELKGLTEEEIMKELSDPNGGEFSNAYIEPGADIPFMLVFIMPAGEANEFVVELADVKMANGK